MTGPEHYRIAERILGTIAETPEDSVGSVAAAATAAHAHATLALAAATALQRHSYESFPQADRMAWYRAASGQPAEIERQRDAREAEAAEFAQEVTA